MRTLRGKLLKFIGKHKDKVRITAREFGSPFSVLIHPLDSTCTTHHHKMVNYVMGYDKKGIIRAVR